MIRSCGSFRAAIPNRKCQQRRSQVLGRQLSFVKIPTENGTYTVLHKLLKNVLKILLMTFNINTATCDVTVTSTQLSAQRSAPEVSAPSEPAACCAEGQDGGLWQTRRDLTIFFNTDSASSKGFTGTVFLTHMNKVGSSKTGQRSGISIQFRQPSQN